MAEFRGAGWVLAGLLGVLGCEAPRPGPAVSPLGPAALRIEPGETVLTAGQGADFRARAGEDSLSGLGWEAPLGGRIDRGGHFTAPDRAGDYRVRATLGGRFATARVRVVPPPRGPVTAPARVRAGARGLQASVPAQEGATYAWTVEGGSLQGEAHGPRMLFQAGTGSRVVLACRVVNAAGLGLDTSLEIPLGQGIVLTPSSRSAVLSAGGRRKFGFELEGGRTGDVVWSVLEPGGGKVDASGHYRAPADPGSYTLQVASREDPSVRTPIRVRVVAAPTGPVRAPRRIAAGTAGLEASVPEQEGCTYAWTLTGGTPTLGVRSPRLTFQAGQGPELRLTCLVTNEAGDSFEASLKIPVKAR